MTRYYPSYSSLEVEQFAAIHQKLGDAGFNVKVIFLMRDPAERCWSAAKMCLRNRQLTDSEQLKRVTHAHENTLANEGVQLRTGYQETVMALEGAFNPTQIYFGFYENMFTPEQVEVLLGFIGFESDSSRAADILNASATLPLTRDLAAMARELFADTYEFCSDRFPETNTLWDIAYEEATADRYQQGFLDSLFPYFKK